MQPLQTQLTAQLAAIQTRLATIEAAVNNSNIYSFNLASFDKSAPIKPLRNDAGELPDNFPATRQALKPILNQPASIKKPDFGFLESNPTLYYL